MEDELCFLPGIIENFCTNTESLNVPSEIIIDSTDTMLESNFAESQLYDTPNCLALTIIPDYKYLSVKNILTRFASITYKTIFSTIVLNVIKLFL